MKKVLVVAFAVAIGISAMANAQVGRVQVYFDEGLQFTSWHCPAAPIGSVTQTLYVVAENFGIWMAGIEYQIFYPTQLMFLGDVMVPDAMPLGESPSGIQISFLTPLDAHTKVVVQMVTVLWLCDNCGPANENAPIIVMPYPGQAWVRAWRWPDLHFVYGVGMTSFICWVDPVQETTWGQVKALYQ